MLLKCLFIIIFYLYTLHEELDLSSFCGSKYTGYFPHPEDCSKFISCVERHGTIQSCPAETNYDQLTGLCDVAHKVRCNKPTFHHSSDQRGHQSSEERHNQQPHHSSKEHYKPNSNPRYEEENYEPRREEHSNRQWTEPPIRSSQENRKQFIGGTSGVAEHSKRKRLNSFEEHPSLPGHDQYPPNNRDANNVNTASSRDRNNYEESNRDKQQHSNNFSKPPLGGMPVQSYDGNDRNNRNDKPYLPTEAGNHEEAPPTYPTGNDRSPSRLSHSDTSSPHVDVPHDHTSTNNNEPS